MNGTNPSHVNPSHVFYSIVYLRLVITHNTHACTCTQHTHFLSLCFHRTLTAVLQDRTSDTDNGICRALCLPPAGAGGHAHGGRSAGGDSGRGEATVAAADIKCRIPGRF